MRGQKILLCSCGYANRTANPIGDWFLVERKSDGQSVSRVSFVDRELDNNVIVGVGQFAKIHKAANKLKICWSKIPEL